MADGNAGTVSLAATTVLTGNTANGTVWLNELDGSFAYTPAPGFVGIDTFTYQAVDAVSHTASVNTTVTINVGGYLSIPQNLKLTSVGDTVVVPVNLASGNPANSGGLTNATIGINYDASKLSLPDGDLDVSEGTLNSAAGWTNFTVNTNTPGQIVIATSNTGGALPLSSTAGGSLAFITFTLVGQPTGTSVVNLSGLVPAVTQLDVAGAGTGGNSIPLPFAVSPVDNTNFNGSPGTVDGLVTFPIGTTTTVSAQVGGTSVTTVTYGTQVTLKATVTAASGSTAPTAGSVDFQDNGNDLGLVTTEAISGTKAIFTLVTTSTQLQVTGGIHSITTIYTPGTSDFYSDETGNLTSGLNVTPAALTIKASTNTKSYDANTSAAAIPTVTGLFGSDTVTGMTEVYSDANIGTGKTLSVVSYTVVDGNGGQNYIVTTATNNTGAIVSGPFSKFAVTIVGSTTIVAGSPFQFTVQATDSFGNPVTSYTGPANVTTNTNVNDPQGNFPISGALQLNATGFGFFQGVLKTVGQYTLTTTATGGFSGTSSVITVVPSFATNFGVVAPPSAITGVPLNFTVTAFDQYHNVVTGYQGTVQLTSTDLAAQFVGNPYTFTTTGASPDNGIHTFSATLKTPGNQTITATDAGPGNSHPTVIIGTSNQIVTRGLLVTSVTPTADGFTATFNKAFVPADLTLYGGKTQITIPDVVMTGNLGVNGIHGIHGSLVIDPSNAKLTFKGTSSYIQLLNTVFSGNNSVALPDGTYTITLVSGSGSNGFLDALGGGLDGLNNGGTANYTTTFTTNFQAHATPILTTPDFARGPDSTSTIQVPNGGPANGGSNGIPITLYNAVGLTDATFTVTYNTNIFTITGAMQGANSDASDPAGLFQLTGNTGGVATFTFHDANPQSGTVVLGDIAAFVPNSAKAFYQVKEQLLLGSIVLNNGAISGALGSSGIHVNAYFGDVNASGGTAPIDGADVLEMDDVAQGRASGFHAFRQLDPVIVGDVAGDRQVDAGDVSLVNSFILHLPAPQIPTPPGLTGFSSPSSVDPTLSLGSTPGITNDASASSQMVSVLLDHPRPDGSSGLNEAVLALTYDPSVLTLSASDITLGSIPISGTGWQLTTAVDAVTGQIGIQLYSQTPITTSQAGSLVNIAFHVKPGATATSTPVRLVDTVTAGGQTFGTGLTDFDSAMILSPGVDSLMVPTSFGLVSSINSLGTDNLVAATTASHHEDFDNLNSNLTRETAAALMPLLESDVNEATPLGVLSNGTVAGETPFVSHTVPASLIVTGALAFQPGAQPTATSIGQVIQIGNAPLLVSFSSGMNSRDLVDKLFQAWSRKAEAPAENDSPSVWSRSMNWDALQLDWLPMLNQSQETEASKGDATSSADESAASPAVDLDSTAALDDIFARMADDMDDFSDL